VTLIDTAQADSGEAGLSTTISTTIHVCITCRRPDDPEDFPRPGAAFARAVATAAADADPDIIVRRVRCLANCKRGLSAAIRRRHGWTYVFGDLDAVNDAPALVGGARLLAGAGDRVMPWRGRPEPLKRGMIARIPPVNFEDAE